MNNLNASPCISERFPNSMKISSIRAITAWNTMETRNTIHGRACISTQIEKEIEEDFGRLKLEEDQHRLRKMGDPKLPSKREVDEHYLMGHVIYRNWCEICVKSRGREMDHRIEKAKERRLREYSMDYCFPGDEMGYRWIILVARERGSKTWMATS